ncbi:MAG: Trm112 family protein [Thermoprotei archaeon]
MRYWGLDYLRCIYCKAFPLKLIPLETTKEEVDVSGLELPLCKNYCGYLNEHIKPSKEYPCKECLSIGVKTGVLYCEKCKHWYPIRDGIVHILRDSKRREGEDKEFLRKWRDKLPREVLIEGKPYNIADEIEE